MGAVVMARKAKCDSVAGAVELSNKIKAGMPKPTEPLSDDEQRHFVRAVKSKHLSDLTDIDLTLFTQLAKVLQLMDEATEKVKTEGYVIHTDRGDTVHPAVRALDSFSKHVGNLVRVLGLSASQRGSGSGAQQKNRDRANAEAFKTLEKAASGEEQGLI